MTNVIIICVVLMLFLIVVALWVSSRRAYSLRADQEAWDNLRDEYSERLLQCISSPASDEDVFFHDLHKRRSRRVLAKIMMPLFRNFSGTEYYTLLRLWRDTGMERYMFKEAKGGRGVSKVAVVSFYTDIEPDRKSWPALLKLASGKERYERFYALMALLNRADCDVVETLKGYDKHLGLFEHVQICSLVARRKFLSPEYVRLFSSENRSVVVLAIRMARYFSYAQFAPLLETIAYGKDRELASFALEVMFSLRLPRAGAVALEVIPTFDTQSRKSLYRFMLTGNLIAAVYLEGLYESESDVMLRKYMRTLLRNSRVMLRRVPVLN